MKKLFLFLFIGLKLFAQEPEALLQIIIAGDIFPSPSLINGGINPDGTRNYLPYYEYVKDIIKEGDLSIAWFGGPVAGEKEEFSGYPVYNNPPEFAKAAVEAGFDLFFHTNHLLDRGIKGLIRTLKFFKSLNSLYLGAYENEEESKKIYYFEKSGIKVAILSYLYGANAPVKTEKWMINFIDLQKISNDILTAKSEGANFIIVGLHWGEEYKRFPSRQQKQLAKMIASFGADVIAGSHPHVIQPAEKIGKTFVIYSHGNFLSSQRKRYTDCGIITRLRIEKRDGQTYLKSASYIPVWVKWQYHTSAKKFITRVLPIIEIHRKYLKKEIKILSKNEYEKMMLAFKDTILHLNNKDISFLYEGEL